MSAMTLTTHVCTAFSRLQSSFSSFHSLFELHHQLIKSHKGKNYCVHFIVKEILREEEPLVQSPRVEPSRS